MFKGISLLIGVLCIFSVFTFKAPKGQKAMSGLANAAVATFLVEAIHRYINGGLLNIGFLENVGSISGNMGGVAAAALVVLAMGGNNPIYAVGAAAAVSGYGILPGFLAGYAVGLIAPYMERYLPEGIGPVLGVLIVAPLARGIALLSAPIISSALQDIGVMIAHTADQSPYIMGFVLGGIIKVICTSPLSSMALTAMLGLKGLAMGISALACVGGSFTNGVMFRELHLGGRNRIAAVMLEPLTQADVVSANAVPIYISNFFGGGLAGLGAAFFRIVNDAPGTASPIPGLIAPFGFNPPLQVFGAIGVAVLGGTLAGYTISSLYKGLQPTLARYRENLVTPRLVHRKVR